MIRYTRNLSIKYLVQMYIDIYGRIGARKGNFKRCFKKFNVILGFILATAAGLILISLKIQLTTQDSARDFQGESLLERPRFSDGVRRSLSKHTFRDVQEVKKADGEEFIPYDDVVQRLDKLVSDLKEVLPTQYLNTTVNPCWYDWYDEKDGSSTMSLTCVPAFYLVGFPKCGTTELYNLLTLHPRFARPNGKEPHWWTGNKNLSSVKNHFREYIRWFHRPSRAIEIDRQKITGDCSASTVWKTIFGQDIKQYPLFGIPYVLSKVFPHAKFIVIMRNPVSHLYSRFWYNCKLRNVVSAKLQENAPEIFNILAQQHIEGMSRCMQDMGSEEICSSLPHRRAYLPRLLPSKAAMVEGKECGYIEFADSMYHTSLKEWFRFIPRNQILVLRTEDMASGTVSVAQTMFRFLGLGEMDTAELAQGIAEFGKSNSQSETKSSDMTLATSTIEILQKFFSPHNTKLANLLEDDNFLWL